MRLAIGFIWLAVFAACTAVGDQTNAATPDSSTSPAAMTDYYRALEEYTKARQAYEAVVSAYWSAIAEKKRLRLAKRQRNEQLLIEDYVLTQPPVYTGPPKPPNPSAPPPEIVPAPYVPVVADFLRAAKQEFDFVPRRAKTEIEFKRAYATVAAAAGLTKDQVVRIYSFEATGNGQYDVQAGLEPNRPNAHAIATALGYNQLLATNSVELLAESGDKFIESLSAKAATLPKDQSKALQRKIVILKKMIAFTRTVPDDWGQHQILANTPKGLGIHAMNLDVDVGPLMQTQMLLDSVIFARKKGFGAVLTAAELEMMNLTGDGNGFDMITMPLDWRNQVPTANFFQPGGYKENPVAQRNNIVSTLIAATDSEMDKEIQKQGAKDLAALFPE